MLTTATILGFYARKMERKELKASMLTQSGPVGALCRNLSTAM